MLDGGCIGAYQKHIALQGEYQDARWAVSKDWNNVRLGKIERVRTRRHKLRLDRVFGQRLMAVFYSFLSPTALYVCLGLVAKHWIVQPGPKDPGLQLAPAIPDLSRLRSVA